MFRKLEQMVGCGEGICALPCARQINVCFATNKRVCHGVAGNVGSANNHSGFHPTKSSETDGLMSCAWFVEPGEGLLIL